MSTEASPSVSFTHSKSHTYVGLFLLGILLFLRLPFLTGLGWFYGEEGLPDWAMAVFAFGTYLTTATLIWWERKRLRDFHVDILGGLVFAFQVFCFIIGFGLFAVMRRSRAKFPSPPKRIFHWLLLGAFAGIGIAMVSQWLDLNPPQARASFSASFGFLLPSALIQMLNAAVWEEPLFRGFLWGYLRKAGWKDLWILLFQAALFTLGHAYYLRTEPVLTWAARMLIPSLTLGLVAWGARSIAASMVAHGFANAAGDMIMHSRSAAEAMQTATSALIVIAVVFFGSLIVVRLRETGRIAAGGAGRLDG